MQSTLHVPQYNAVKTAMASTLARPLTTAVIALLLLLSNQVIGQITGSVYRDFNADGVRSYTAATPFNGEIGVGGVTVTVYSGTSVVGTTVTTTSSTSTNGGFSVTPTGSGPYRVEFTNLPAGYFEGPRGAGSGTSVQFVATSTASNVNLGINYPADYCQANPNFVVPCYVNGDPTSTTGNAGSQPILVTLPYSATSPTASGGNTTAESGLALNSQVGTVYGIAYQRAKGYTFSSAFLKRHSGLGTGGAGAIYITKPSGATTTSALFVAIPNVGTVATNTARGLPGNTTDQNRDPLVYDQIGKAGLGDLEISEDGAQLYVVNLNDRQLYRVPIINPTSVNPTAGTPVAFALPAVTQRTGSVFRPFAVKYYRGRVYVGGVTTNEAVPTSTTVNFGAGSTAGNLITRDTAQMKAVVFEFNPVTNTFATTPVLSFPLTFKRGAIDNDKTGVDRSDYWFPWTDIEPGFGTNPVPSRFSRNDQPNQSYPQAWFTDIEFDVDGSMIIGIRDRFGDQWGNSNLGPNASTGTRVYRTNAAGDIMQAGKCNTATNLWTLESNAQTCTHAATAGAGNGQGPGNGEFYYTDFTQQGPPFPAEITNGGLALFPGKGEVSSTAVDPTYDINAGGIRRFDNRTGFSSSATGVQVYVSGDVSTFGKANGLGDLELTCNEAPIEIGNRIFNDGPATAANGIQDEPTSLSGIVVQLYQGATLVATTTTNATGEYYFNNSNVTGGLLPSTAYQIRVATTQTALAGFVATKPNVGTDNEIDSDGITSGTNVIIDLTTGLAGSNDHSFDIGFTTCATLTNPSVAQSVCSGTPVSSLSVTTNSTVASSIRFVYFTTPQSGTAMYSGGTTLGTVTPSGGTASITNVAFPANAGTTPITYYVYAVLNPMPGSADCLPSQVIQVTIKPNPVATATGGTVTCIAPATVSGTSSLTGSTFSWTGPVTSTAQSFTTNTAGNYILTVTANGCTSTSSATAVVTLNTTPPATVTATNNGPLTCTLITATLTASSSTTGVTYRWLSPLTATAASTTVSTPGTYSVIITSANGCTALATTTVTSNTAAPTATVNSLTLTCTSPSGTLTATPSGGTTPYTYLWNTGSTASSITASTAGPYSVTVTGANGCFGTATTTVISNTVAPTASINSLTLTCTSPSGTLTASASGGTAPYTYRWNTSATSSTISVNASGTYSVTVTGANGCFTAVSTTVISNTAAPTASVNSLTLTCTSPSGTLTASASGGTAPYSYLWSTGATTANITASAAGPYSVTVTGANGCFTAISTTVISNTTAPTASVNSLTLTCTSPSGTLTASASGGTAPYSYLWSTGATTVSITASAAGPYSVTVTGANGCFTAVSTTVISNTAAPTASINSLTLTCTSPSGTLTASASGGTAPYTYRWNTSATSSTISVNASGTYSVTVTGANGCFTTVTTNVISNTAAPTVTASVSNTLTVNQPTATISTTVTGGSSPYTYLWTGGQTTPTISVSSAGPYSVTVTGSNGCFTVITTTVVSNTTAPTVSASASNTLTCAQPTATISTTVSGGSGPYTYQWTGGQTTPTISVSSAGPYSVTVTGSNGATAVATTTVISNTIAPTASINSLTLTCTSPSGTLTASASGSTAPYSYLWSTGATTASITASAAGPYSVTVTGANGCFTAVSTTVISNTTAPTASINSLTLTCANPSGTLSTTVAGGTAPYTYLWGGGQTTSAITANVAGPYSVTVTGANGCFTTITTTVQQNTTPPTGVAATNTGPLTCTLLTVTVSASSTTSGVTYSWTGPGGFVSTAASFQTSIAGFYSVIITNPVNGCTTTVTTTVGQNSAPPAGVVASNTGPLTCTLTTATVSVTSTTPNVTYSWAGPGGFTSTAQSFTTNSTGTYSVTVTGANGCVTTTSTILQQNVNTPTVTASNTGPLTCTLTTATVSATGSAGVTYRWTGPGAFTSTAQSFTTSTVGTYSVIVTAANGCTATTTTTLNQNLSAPTVTATNTGPLTCTLTTVTVSATASEPVTYQWNIGVSTASFTTSLAGIYSVTVTNANGCTATATTTVNQNVNPPVVTASNTGPLTCAQPIVTVSASSAGNVTYRWSSGQTTASFSTSLAGTYSVTVTNANGCFATASTTVGQDVAPPAGVTASNNGPLNCAQTTVTVSATSTTAGVTYRWTGPGAFTSTAQSFTTSVAGTYSVTVTSTNGCTISASTNVVQNTTSLANVSASNTGPLTCTLTTVTVNATTTTPGVTYSWTGPGGFTSTAQSFTTSVAGTYQVTLTGPTGCQPALASTVVGQNTTPPAGVTATNTGPLSCTLSNVTVSASSTTSGVTYQWMGPGGFTSTAQSFVTATAGSFTVVVTSPNGCTASTTTTVSQDNTGVQNITINNSGPLSCTLTTVTVSANSTTPGVAYQWAGPGGFTSVVPSFATSTAGTYSLTLTAPNGCTAVTSTTVGQNTTPPAGVVASNTGPLTCTLTTATVSVTSTTPNVTYSWAGPGGFTSTAQSFTTNSTGTYSVTVTGANGCISTAATTLNQNLTPPAGVAVGNTGPLTCTLTTATVSVTSTTPNVTYSWAGPGGFTSTAQSFATSVPGTYSVTITNTTNGCTVTTSTSVGQNTTPPANVTATNSGPISCTLATVTVSASSTTTGVIYSWVGPNGFTATAQSFTTSIAGTYSVTITSANGCVATASTIVQQRLTPPTVTATNTGPLTCTLTSITVSATSSGTPTYLWSSGQTTASFSTSLAGTYSVTVTGANGCTAITTTTVQVNQTPPTVTAGNTGPLSCTLTSVQVSASANELVTYLWSSGQTTASFPTSLAGIYSVTVTNDAGCTAVTTTIVQQTTQAPTVTLANNGPLTCAQTSVTLTATAGEPVLYTWSTGATTPTITVSAAGPYSVTVTSANGCTAVATTTVTSNTLAPTVTVSVSNTLTVNQPTATISTVATPGVTFLWSTGATTPTISVSTAGTYSVTVTSANGCSAVATTTVYSNTAAPTVSASVSNTLTCAQPTATISTSVNGAPSVTYLWNTGATSATILVSSAGPYSVTVTAPNGATASTTTTVLSNTVAPVASVNSLTLSCTQPTGTLTASASGGTAPYSYLWSTGATTASITASAAGPYSVTVTGANGCFTAVSTTVISNTAAPTTSVNSLTLTCTSPSGTLTASASGGTAPYSYLWSTGATTANITASAAGPYSVTVTGANGCFTTVTTNVISNTVAPVASVNSLTLTCANPSGTLTATVTGGSGPYSYLWSTGATTTTIPASTSGPYSVTVTGANGCFTIVTTNVFSNTTAPTVTASVSNTITPAQPTAIITTTATAGVAYLWSTGATSASIAVNSAGTYSVTVISANGCTAMTSVTVVSDQSIPMVSASVSNVLTCNLLTAIVSTTASPGVTYLWSTGATTANITVSTAGPYSVTVTAPNGATASATTMVASDTVVPTVSASVSNTLTCAQPTATVMSTNTPVGNSYVWMGPNNFISSASSFSTATAGLYSLTVTGTNGCTAITTTTVFSDTVVPMVTASASNILTVNQPTATISTTATAGVTYLWNTGETTPTISVSAAGTYSVTVTSANGCSAVATTLVTSDTAAPMVTASVSNTLTCTQPTAKVTALSSPGVSYLWNTGETTAMISVSMAGPYSVTVTAPNGATAATSTTVISDTAVPTASVNSLTLTCTHPTGVLSTTVTGSTAPYSYLWNTGETTPVVSISMAGPYSVTVTGSNGCFTVITTNVVSDTVVPTVTASASNTLTPAQPTATISTTVNQAVTYLWSTGATTASINVNSAGTYSVTVTSANGCTATTTTTVTSDTALPMVMVSISNNLNCTQPTATISATATPGASFLWNTGETTATISVSVAGPYSVTVTAPNGATASQNTAVFSDTAVPTVTTTVSNTLTCSQPTATVMVMSAPTGSSYVWTGPNGFTSTASSFTTSTPGTYSVVVTGPNGCTVTTTTNAVSDTAVPTVTASISNTLTVNQPTAMVSATASPGATYLWSTGATTPTISVSTAGPYSVTVTGTNGCTAALITTVVSDTVAPAVTASVSNTLTCAQPTALISTTINGAASVSYLWSTGAITPMISVSMAGPYSVTVTAPNGTTASTTTTVISDKVAPGILANASNRLTCAQPTALISTTVNQTVTYLWNTSETSSSITVNTAGTYSVTVTGANGCTAVATANVISDTVVPMVSASVSNTLTVNQPTATISTVATTGVSFLWSTGETTSMISVSAAGTYSVTVTGANGCTATTTVVVYSNMNAPIVTASVSNTLTCAQPTATISTTISGMTPVDYLWSTGETTATISVSAAGPYSVTVTGANGATAVATTTVISNTVAPVASVNSLTLTCANPSGTLSTTVTGGAVPYTYAWSTGATTPTIPVNTAGPYSVTVTGANGCITIVTTTVISDTALPTATIAASSTLIISGNSVTLTASCSTGTITWSTGSADNGLTSLVLSPTATTTYSVTCTTPTGCKSVASTTIVVQSLASLGNYVFVDANKNGIQDGGDSPLPGVMVVLLDATNTPIASTTTNASGFYSFTGLTPGVPYSLSFTAPTGYTFTAAQVGGNDATDSDADPATGKTRAVTLAAGENNVNFAAGLYIPSASLGNFVFVDANGNGIQDAGDTGIPGVTVTLLSSGTVVAFTTTDASGLYSFTGLTPGVPYSLSFTAPTGYSATLQNVGNDATDSDGDPATGLTGIYSLTANENNFTVGMGYFLPVSLGNKVFADANQNGIQDGGDMGIPGATVTLLSSGTVVATTTTDINGVYSFTGLTPGVPYSLSFTAPVNYTATTFPGGVTAPITLTSGQNNTTLNAGFYRPTASLGNYVFVDANKNGIQDGGDSPLPGVMVVLLDATNTPIASTTTNASGFYSFTGLTPGVPYSLSFTAPTGYTFTAAQVGGNDATDSDADPATGKTRAVTLAAGENNINFAAGLYPITTSLSLTKLVDKTRAEVGDIVTYTLVVTNSGTVTATNVAVRDSSTAGLAYVANSATPPAGTTFTQGSPISTWTIANLSSGQTLSLTFQAKVDSTGILYNQATVSGDTARVCTSVPVKVCTGTNYSFTLTVASGQSSYQWYRNGNPILGQTTNTLLVTTPGMYSLVKNGVVGKCSDFSCCPFIVEEIALPAAFQAMAVPVTCTANAPQTNGRIVISGFDPSNTYQYSAGTQFNPTASLSGAAQAIPANGVLVNNLINPASAQPYTIRLYNSSGCFRDVSVLLTPTVCNCPVDVCIPFVIQKTKRVR